MLPDRGRGRPLEDRAERKREREGAEKAHLRRNVWGIASLPDEIGRQQKMMSPAGPATPRLKLKLQYFGHLLGRD